MWLILHPPLLHEVDDAYEAGCNQILLKVGAVLIPFQLMFKMLMTLSSRAISIYTHTHTHMNILIYEVVKLISHHLSFLIS